jgi:hypothetical protein
VRLNDFENLGNARPASEPSRTSDFLPGSPASEMTPTNAHLGDPVTAASECGSPQVSEPLPGENGENPLHPVTVDDMSKLPTWLTSTNMVSYLRGVSQESLWQELVTTFMRFEMLNPTTGVCSMESSAFLVHPLTMFIIQKLPTVSRPGEVQAWIKSKKKDSPPAVDLEAYGLSFMEWWRTLQPSWRLCDDGSLSHEPRVNEEWSVLGKGGSAGLYTVVVSLSWWIVAAPSGESELQPQLWAAVRDVHWIIKQVIEMILKTRKGKKRPIGNDTAVISGKRCVICILSYFTIMY